jgi:hypothetical protein
VVIHDTSPFASVTDSLPGPACLTIRSAPSTVLR